MASAIDSNDIDCSVACISFVKILNSCPSKNINFRSLHHDDLFEIFMVILSISPYIVSFCLLIGLIILRTTRVFLILMMIFGENFIIEFLKGSLRDPRPNYKCNQQFGNPSNHATFFTSLVVWMLMEMFFLEKKHRFRYTFLKLLLFFSYPLILYSRLYLHYHSFEQILNGIFLGLFISIFWFLVINHIIFKTDNPLKRIFMKLRLNNSMGNDFFLDDMTYKYDNEPVIYKKLLEINKKQDELSKMKAELQGFNETIKNLDILKNKGLNIDNKDIEEFKKNK